MVIVPRLLDADIEKSFRERSSGERAMISNAVSSFTRLLLKGSSSDIVALEGKLRQDASESVEELEVRNIIRRERQLAAIQSQAIHRVSRGPVAEGLRPVS